MKWSSVSLSWCVFVELSGVARGRRHVNQARRVNVDGIRDRRAKRDEAYVCWSHLRLLAALAPLLGAGVAGASAMNMRVFEINDHLLSFYDGRPLRKLV